MGLLLSTLSRVGYVRSNLRPHGWEGALEELPAATHVSSRPVVWQHQRSEGVKGCGARCYAVGGALVRRYVGSMQHWKTLVSKEGRGRSRL